MRAKEFEMVMKKKEFIDAKTAEYMKKIIYDVFGLQAGALSKRYNIDLPDMIRFRVAADKVRRTRQKKGITLKDLAHKMKIAKYKLEYIEEGRVKDINIDLLNQYIDHLKIRKWFEKWKRHNLDVYKRIRKNS